MQPWGGEKIVFFFCFSILCSRHLILLCLLNVSKETSFCYFLFPCSKAPYHCAGSPCGMQLLSPLEPGDCVHCGHPALAFRQQIEWERREEGGTLFCLLKLSHFNLCQNGEWTPWGLPAVAPFIAVLCVFSSVLGTQTFKLEVKLFWRPSWTPVLGSAMCVPVELLIEIYLTYTG